MSAWYFGIKKTKCYIDPKKIDPDIPETIRQTYDWSEDEEEKIIISTGNNILII